MMIGKFTQQKNGVLTSTLHALPTSRKLTFTPEDNKGVDYRIMAEAGGEVGAGWKRTSKDGKAFVSVKLDSPFLSAPVNCALFEQEDGTHALIWDRSAARAQS